MDDLKNLALLCLTLLWSIMDDASNVLYAMSENQKSQLLYGQFNPYPVIFLHSLPRNILDNLESLVAELQRHLDGRLLLLLAHQMPHHGCDELLAPEPLRLLGPQEPDVVGGLLYVTLVRLLLAA